MVLCILHHQGVQLILAYRWARPAILIAGKGRGKMFLFLLFLHFHSCFSVFPVPLFHCHYIFSISFLFFSGRWHKSLRHKMTSKGWVIKPQNNRSLYRWSDQLLVKFCIFRQAFLVLLWPLLSLEPCKLGFWNFIYDLLLKHYRTCISTLPPPPLPPVPELCPFINSCIVSLWDIMKSCEQDSSKSLKLGELIGNEYFWRKKKSDLISIMFISNFDKLYSWGA